MADKAYLDKDGLAEVWSAVEDQVAEASEEIIKVKTVSGDIVSVDDASAYPFLDITADINPIQDLHGYTKPWAGGNGKNILNIDGTFTDNGVTHSVSGDSITLTVSTDSNIWKQSTINIPIELNKEYTISIDSFTVPSGTSPRVIVHHGDTRIAQLTSDTKTDVFTVSSGTASVEVFFRTSQTGNPLTGATFTYTKPMLRLSSTTSDYEPYSNECPISGWDEANVTRTGFNVWDEETESGAITDAGVENSDATKVRSKNYTEIIGGTSVYVKGSVRVDVCTYDRNKTYITKIKDKANKVITLDPNVSYFRLVIYEASYSNATSVNYPSTDTAYHAYNGNTFTIDLGGTRYGAHIDVTSGVMVVDRAIVSPTSVSNFTGITTSASYGNFATVSSALSGLIDEAKVCVISDMCKGISFEDRISTANLNEYRCYLDGGNRLIVRVPVGVNASTAQDFYDIFGNAQFVYYLATPLTVHLTPTQIEALLGTNNVWASTGDISVKYAKMGTDMYDLAAANKLYVEQLVEEKDSKFSPVGFSGELVSFEANQEYPLLDLNVDINPVQDLHGYSKPWAPGNGKNLLPMTVDSIKAANTGGSWSGNAYTHNGVTFTLITDNDNNVIAVQAVGTTGSSLALLYFADGSDTVYTKFTQGSSYTLTDGTSDSRADTYNIRVGDATNALVGYTVNGVFNFTAGTKNTVRLSIAVNQTINKTFYPMIRLASETDATFEPYSNICLITGWDEVNIPRTGKNLLSSPMELGSINGVGDDSVNNTAMRSAHLMPIFPNTSYVYSQESDSGEIWVNYYKDGVFIRRSNIGQNKRTATFTTPENANQLRMRCNLASEGVMIGECQLEFGSTPTDYVPMGKLFTIDLGETRYGCKLNVPSGKLVVSHGFYTVTGDESGAWTLNNTDTLRQLVYKNMKSYLVGVKETGGREATARFNLFATAKAQMAALIGYAYVENGYINMVFPPNRFSTSEEVTTWLQSNNVEVLYELATPVEIQLDPTEITTLLGTNYIWADTGDIDGQYAQLTDDFKDLSMADRRAMSILIEQKLREHGLIS